MQNQVIEETIAFIHQQLCNSTLAKEEKNQLQFLLNLSHKLVQNPSVITTSKFDLTPIPLTQNGYDNLFLVSDCESENPQLWQKVMQNGKVIEVQSGDILIQFK